MTLEYHYQERDGSIVDEEGYRYNVGIILVNRDGKLFWGQRVEKDAWQFPQGGILARETPQQALFRELKEEVGLKPEHVRVLGHTREWMKYDLPSNFMRRRPEQRIVGQKQIWYMLGLQADESAIRLDAHPDPEFETYRWVDYWTPVHEVVDFKREIYHRALTELEPLLAQLWLKNTE